MGTPPIPHRRRTEDGGRARRGRCQERRGVMGEEEGICTRLTPPSPSRLSCTSLLPPPSSLPLARTRGMSCPVCYCPCASPPSCPVRIKTKEKKGEAFIHWRKTSVLVQYFPRTGWRAVNLFEALATESDCPKRESTSHGKQRRKKRGCMEATGWGKSILFSSPTPSLLSRKENVNQDY